MNQLIILIIFIFNLIFGKGNSSQITYSQLNQISLIKNNLIKFNLNKNFYRDCFCCIILKIIQIKTIKTIKNSLIIIQIKYQSQYQLHLSLINLIQQFFKNQIMQPNTNPTPISKLTSYSETPSAASCYLIQRNTKSLLEQIYSETRFNNSTLLKTKALHQLKHVVLLSQKTINSHLQQLLVKLANLYTQQTDTQEHRTLILQVAEILGLTTDFQVVFLTLFETLRPEMIEDKEKSTSKLSINLILILARLILHKQEQELAPFRHKIMSLIEYFSAKFYESDEGLVALLTLVEILLPKLRQISDGAQSTSLFNLLLNIQSTRGKTEDIKLRSHNAFTQLALKCGFPSVAQLYFHEVAPILEKLTQSKSYIKWNKSSKERFQFDTLVRNSREIIPKYIDMIFQVLQGNVKHENDLEVRMDALVLIEYILNIYSIRQDLRQHAVILLKNILIPSIRWKIGAPETKIRKAGILNIITLVTGDLIDEKGITDSFPELLPPLRDCLTDDRQPDLRSVSLRLIEQLLLKSSESVSEDILRDVYVSLLERLDDSKNQLRIQTTKAINAFLICKNVKLIPTIFEYLLNGIFVHFDSECDDLREKLLISLKHASKVNPAKVLEMAKNNLKKMRHTSICEELISYCEEIIDEN